jgi:hypothetical protein
MSPATSVTTSPAKHSQSASASANAPESSAPSLLWPPASNAVAMPTVNAAALSGDVGATHDANDFISEG